MTVQELLDRLAACPPDAEVRAAFDVSDHDTHWAIYDVELCGPDDPRGELVIVKAT